MKSTREQFEEIWPVPTDVYWSNTSGIYLGACGAALEHNARLDTFTRCQESMGPVLSLIDECIKELEVIYQGNRHQGWSIGCSVPSNIERIQDMARIILEKHK